MQHSDALGAAGDVARDGVGAPSREVAPWAGGWTSEKDLPPVPWALHGMPFRTWMSKGGEFSVVFGAFGHQTEIWTTEEGVALLIGQLQAALVTSQTEREKNPPPAYVPDPDDLPF